ncbi:hypothetical protein OWR28_24515 [Chryseobacterium sp. 1B4]
MDETTLDFSLGSLLKPKPFPSLMLKPPKEYSLKWSLKGYSALKNNCPCLICASPI